MRARVFVVAAAALLAAYPSSRLAAQDVPTTPPAPMPLRPVQFPPFVTGRLVNGMNTLTVTNHEQPVVTISLSVPAGGVHVPANKAGLDDMLATLLTKGTATRTADQISSEIESVGGSIGAGAGPDYLTITVSALSENFEQAMNLLADVAAHSTFPQSEVDLAKTQALSGLQLDLSQPASIASRIFRKEIYGAHPYGTSTTPETLNSLTREDVVGYYNAHVKPMGALLIVAGDVQPAQVRTLAARAFAGWTGAPRASAPLPAIPARTSREVIIVNRPGSVQSNIVAGVPFITPRDPALYPLTLMNRILGDGTDSRLFLILREAKSWTYGAYSGFSEPYGRGYFRANTEVRTPVTDSALGELVHQLDRIRGQAPADSEITAAKSYITGSFPLTIETPEQVAGAVAGARLRGQPDNFVTTYRERVAAVTPAQMMAATQRALDVDHLVIVVVGDGRAILPGIKALNLGTLHIVDPDGKPLTEADLAPAAASASVPVRPATVRPGTYSYRILVQGNPFGTETRVITRGNAGGRDAFTVITTTALGPILSQTDTSTFDAATLLPIRVRQGGRMQGQETYVRLDYDSSRVHGNTRTMNQPGQPPAERAVDTTLAAGTFDDNEVGPLIGALPFAAGGHWTLPVFASGKGEVRMMDVRVTGEDSVTTPAGSFQTWKLAVTGLETTVNMWIAKGDAPVLVKLEIVGAPLQFELVSRN